MGYVGTNDVSVMCNPPSLIDKGRNYIQGIEREMWELSKTSALVTLRLSPKGRSLGSCAGDDENERLSAHPVEVPHGQDAAEGVPRKNLEGFIYLSVYRWNWRENCTR